MAFVTKNIELDFKHEIDHRAIECEPIKEKPLGAKKIGYLKDFNGFLIEICTPIKDQ